MLSSEPIVHIVDDDDAIRDAIEGLLKSVGLRTAAFASAQEFLANCNAESQGCLLLDLRLPGLDGLELQRELMARNIRLPIVFLTGHGDVSVAVQAMKRGAIDFLTKPFHEQQMLDAVKGAIARDVRNREQARSLAGARARLANLTERERQVLDLLLQGKSNKMIAADLGLSHKTVEFHRGRIMAKSRSDSLADLVRMTFVAKSGREEPVAAAAATPVGAGC